MWWEAHHMISADNSLLCVPRGLFLEARHVCVPLVHHRLRLPPEPRLGRLLTLLLLVHLRQLNETRQTNQSGLC